MKATLFIVIMMLLTPFISSCMPELKYEPDLTTSDIEADAILYHFGGGLHITLERMDEILDFFSEQPSYELGVFDTQIYTRSNGAANLFFKLAGIGFM